MKRYIRSAKVDNVLEIVIDFCFDFDERIEANFSPAMSEEELDEAIEEMAEEQYVAFMNMIAIRFTQIGFEILEGPRFSNVKDSKSCYFTLCKSGEYDTLTVKIILNVRISDHRLTKRKGKNKDWDRFKARDEYYKKELENYRLLNQNNPDDMYYVLTEIYISGNKFKSYKDAMRYIEKQVREVMNDH